MRWSACARAISYNEPMFSNPSWLVKEPACSSPSRRSSSGSGTRATSPTVASPPSCSWPRAWAARCSSRGPAGVGKTELAKTLADVTSRQLIRLQCYEGPDEGKALYEWKYAKQLLYTQLPARAHRRADRRRAVAAGGGLPHRRAGRRASSPTGSSRRGRCCRRSAPTIRWSCWWTRSTRPEPEFEAFPAGGAVGLPGLGPGAGHGQGASTSRSWC